MDRIKGLTYQEIAARGGGILNSAAKLRGMSEDELFIQAKARLEVMMAQGTVAVMTLGMLLLLVVPLWLAIDTISEHSEQLTAAGKSLAENGLPLPPDWVKTLPLIGERLSASWTQLAVSGASGILAKVLPHAADAGKWVLGQVGGLGGMLIQFLLVVIVAAILYSGGEAAARMMRRFGRRLAGERGENSIILAGQAIRGVALGVGVTAIVQTVLGGIGLAVAGESIHALGAIKAGETLSAGQDICAGAGYGVFAGLNVQEASWNASGQVWSPACPEGLRSGLWVGPNPI